METFASEMLELTGIDPTVECVTIASTAFKVFQTKFLEPYTIALEPLRRMAPQPAEPECGSPAVVRISKCQDWRRHSGN